MPPNEPKTAEETAAEEVERLYVVLKPEAELAARNYVLSRTPTELQGAMTEKMAGDFPDPTVAYAKEAKPDDQPAPETEAYAPTPPTE